MVSSGPGFEEFVSARSGSLVRSAWLLTGDRQLAEDLLQTALARLWPRWSRVASGSNPEAYVRRVMVTTWGTWWRRRWRAEVSHGQLPETAGPDPYEVAERRMTVLRALARLPARQRAVVVLRYYDDLSEAEIADILGCAPGTVKSQAAKALTSLRGLLPLDELTGEGTAR